MLPPGAHDIECLSRMPECELAEGAPDVRGWDVVSPTSVRLGVVKDLLVDLVSLRVRYLDVVLEAGGSARRRVLLPIGKVWINDALDEVVVSTSATLEALPEYEPTRFNREFENTVLSAFGDEVAADFYACPAFDDRCARPASAASTNCGRRTTDADGEHALPLPRRMRRSKQRTASSSRSSRTLRTEAYEVEEETARRAARITRSA